MYRLPVHERYCNTGVGAHTVFFPVMGQYIPNVAGWGGDAGKDSEGRPVVIVMGITVPLTAQERYNYDHRAIILHELVHGLGFGIFHFQHSFNSDGSPRQIVKKQVTTDVDGTTDRVWFVVSPRTLAAARAYFNCSTLKRLPLMGENQLGAASRGSHWETRIMNDEFMAYGEGARWPACLLARPPTASQACPLPLERALRV